MIRLILVRHGQTKANLNHFLQGQSDGAMTNIGKQQAEDLAHHLQGTKIDRILSSDMKRAKNTAAAIAILHGVAVEVKPIIREWNCGKLDGLPAEELFRALEKSEQPLPDFRPEEGETLREVQKRALKFLHKIEDDSADLNVVVCSHGDFLRMLISVITHISIEEANGIHLNNTSYSIFERGDKQWNTIAINNCVPE
jgi:alpha-ribazole phosphatase